MIKLNGKPITVSDVIKVAKEKEKVALDTECRSKMRESRKVIEAIIENKQIVYGVTTGFGAFKNKFISGSDVKKLQLNLILSHAVGVGNPFSNEIVRGIMFLIANYLTKGASGIRPVVVETLIQFLNKGIYPIVPEKGSVGSSGDLAPSAHVVLALIGEGDVYYQDKKMPAKKALKLAEVTPLILEAKEGLALINNTATMTSNACIALDKAFRLAQLCDITGALSAEALRATNKAFYPGIHNLKPHNGQIETAATIMKLLSGSTMLDNTKVQDQYSIRCIPQIHGAVKEAIAYVNTVITTEINSVTDNPLIIQTENGKEMISGGNFHGEPVAIAMDALGIALCELGNVSDRRVASLLDPATNNKLPAFLTANGGLNSGMMILQYATASLVSENKVLAHPASVDSIPTSANVEDLVSMGTIAARKALEIAKNVERVLAIELIVACQAIEFRLNEGLKLGKGTKKIFDKVRTLVPYFESDSLYNPYMNILINSLDTIHT